MAGVRWRAAVGGVVAGLMVLVAIAGLSVVGPDHGDDRQAHTVSGPAPAGARPHIGAGAGVALPARAVPANPTEASATFGSIAAADPSSSQTMVAGCPWTGADREPGSTRRNRRVVELAYCVLLDRPVDADGLVYWSGQLDEGLRPSELVAQLVASPEYLQARIDRDPADRSPFSVLDRIGSPGTPPPTTVAPRPDEPLRGRRPLSPAEFATWVAERQLDGIEAITVSLAHARIDGDGQRINVAYVNLSATRAPQVRPDRGRAAVGTWASEIGADVAVNGNWYAPWDGPAVADGQVYGGGDHGYTALFGFTAAGEVVLDHHREVNPAVDPRVTEGVSGHPTLVHRGQRTTDFGGDPTFVNRHPRTAIGLDGSGSILILVTVDGRSSTARGMTGAETAELLERLGAADAVMLDGGGSTTMWLADRGVVNRPSGGSPRAVGNEIAAFGS